MIAYQPHIDGLRAIAVLSVLIFHLNESWLPGGFVGVDIFFVISGYLITKLIIREIDQSGGFSFKGFYVRRVRRLFPAMAATFALSLVAAYFILSPAHVIEFAKSLISAIFSVSNIYFWNTAGYFDSDSSFKPLLHTWSLAVEEQFYLIWPLLLFLIYRCLGKAALIVAVIAISLLSLALNLAVFENRAEIMTWWNASFDRELDLDATAFYLLPFRVFELGIGAGLVFVRVGFLPSWLRTLGMSCGLILIGLSFGLLSKALDFPSYAALLPCVGAGLVIACAGGHWVEKLLSNGLMVGIGLISYSLYLVHWPIIVFYKMTLFRPLVWYDYTAIVILALVIAALFYRFIEQPFRKTKKSSSRGFLISIIGVCIALSLVSAHAIQTKGWLDRYPAAVLQQLERVPEDYIELFAQEAEFYEGDFANNGKPKVLVIGDSLSADLINALVKSEAGSQLDITGIRLFYPCLGVFPLSPKQERQVSPRQDGHCRVQREVIERQSAIIDSADTVILASYWNDARVLPLVQNTVSHLTERGVKNVMVLGQKLQQQHGVKLLAAHPLPVLTRLRIPLSAEAQNINQVLRDAAAGYYYFDLTSEFCNAEGCRQATKEGYVIVYDVVHLTPEGAIEVGKNFTQTDWFKRILNSGE